ncbi:MAG: ATP-binding protein [Bacteroidota bacterium]
MNKWYLCIYLLIFSWNMQAQNSISEDSLQLVDLLQQVGRYCGVNPDSAIWLSDSCISLATQFKRFEFISKTHYLRGVAYKNKSDFEAAEAAYQAAIDEAALLKDSLLVADGLYGMGNLKRHQGDYSTSLQLLHNALAIRENNGASKVNLARTYNSIGNVLFTTGNTVSAIQQFRRSLIIHQQEGNKKFVASTQANIGGMYAQLNEIDSAIHYLQPALEYYQSIDHPLGTGAAAINIAEAFLNKKDLSNAQYYADLASKNFILAKDKARQGMALNTAASIAREQGNYQKAITFAQQSLDIALEVGRPDNIRDQYENLSTLEVLNENWQSAFQYFQKYTTLKDSLFNEKVNEQMQVAQQQMEAIAKDQEISELKRQQIDAKRNRQWLVLGLMVAMAFLAIAYWTIRSRQKALARIQAEQENTQRLLLEKDHLLQELKNAQLQLIQNEKMVSLGQLTAGIAHEINNPINFVSANLTALQLDFKDLDPLLELLEKGDEEQLKACLPQLSKLSKEADVSFVRNEIKQLLKSIGNGAERTKKIVQSLGTFSRNTSEQFLPANINEGIQSTLMLLRSNLPAAIKISIDLAELPPIICQISRLNQVFLNLINNAAQAIEGDGQVHIETRLVDHKVQIKISDNGKGMDEATRRRIFEPFFTTKKVGSGTGLGLSISYGIIKQHQGEIEVESIPEKGTSFLLQLPLDPTRLKT